jgi:hypothetical protein
MSLQASGTFSPGIYRYPGSLTPRIPAPPGSIGVPRIIKSCDYYFYFSSWPTHLLARKKLSSSLCDKQSEAGSAALSSTIPSDQKLREAKSTPYTCPSYETILATKGSFMGKFDLGITDASKKLCRTLLEAK